MTEFFLALAQTWLVEFVFLSVMYPIGVSLQENNLYAIHYTMFGKDGYSKLSDILNAYAKKKWWYIHKNSRCNKFEYINWSLLFIPYKDDKIQSDRALFLSSWARYWYKVPCILCILDGKCIPRAC